MEVREVIKLVTGSGEVTYDESQVYDVRESAFKEEMDWSWVEAESFGPMDKNTKFVVALYDIADEKLRSPLARWEILYKDLPRYSQGIILWIEREIDFWGVASIAEGVRVETKDNVEAKMGVNIDDDSPYRLTCKNKTIGFGNINDVFEYLKTKEIL